jgi:hypothetical protein
MLPEQSTTFSPADIEEEENWAVWKQAALGVVALGTAFGGPIAYYAASDAYKAVRQPSLASSGYQLDAVSAEPGSLPQSPLSLPPPPEATPVHDLTEVFRFDITRAWITQRWPRVTTGLSKPELEGYRVVLMTGTAPSDLAGSLTYYFNAQQQVQEIGFRGSTGDVRSVVQLLTTHFGFGRRLLNDPALLAYEKVNAEGRQTGFAHIRSTPVLKASEQLQRFEIELTIERP